MVMYLDRCSIGMETENSLLLFCNKTFDIKQNLCYNHYNKTGKETKQMAIVKEANKSKLVICNNIQDLLHYINQNPIQSYYRYSEKSGDISEKYADFSGTANYGEAEDLLLHGWDSMAQELKSKIGVNMRATGHTQRAVYSMAGVVPCVPRYLQGMSDSMVAYKRIPKKDKVLTINKAARYSWKVRKETIIEESIKVLRLVQNLEQQGYRINLNVLLAINEYVGNAKTYVTKLKIKTSGQRLNLKQMAFPLVHPSMSRRIWFRCIEHDPFCNTRGFANGYGVAASRDIVLSHCKGEYYIPEVVTEQEIKDISKYWVE